MIGPKTDRGSERGYRSLRPPRCRKYEDAVLWELVTGPAGHARQDGRFEDKPVGTGCGEQFDLVHTRSDGQLEPALDATGRGLVGQRPEAAEGVVDSLGRGARR
jgi:hypothetical protein